MNPWGIPESNTRQTLELRDVIAGGVDIWDFEYPSYYKGDAKKAFESKVIDHYLYRQIGAETVGRFLHYFRRTVREIMPLYIQRYESVDLMKDSEIRPLDNYNMIEEYEREQSSSSQTTGSSSAESTGTGSGTKENTIRNKGTNVRSDTPGNTLNLSVNIDSDGIETVSHASEVGQEIRKETNGETSTASESSSSTGTSTDSSEGSGTESHRLTRRGNIGVTTYAQLLEGYRETFLNIDMEIIRELETCFLGVY